MKDPSFVTYSAKQKMKLLRLRNLISWFALAGLSTVVGAGLGILVKNTSVFAQSDQKKVSLERRERRHEQIKFSNLRIGESTKRFEEEFSENKGWIGRMSFQVENISDKDIIYLSVNVLFPETNATGNLMAYTFSFGNRPGSRLQNAKPFNLAKGEKMTIDLADQYQRITRFVSERHSIDDITQIELEAGFIVFADGTAWAVGSFFRQNPDDPTRWVQIDMPGYVPTKPRDKGDKP